MYKLLIVDDEPIIRRGIKELIDLEALSIVEVYEASEGEEALNLVREKKPHIVLADINMPNMDGLALAQAIKGLNRIIRVAIITGYDYFDYAVAAIKAGVDDFILKPVSKNDIRELLQKLVKDIREEEARVRVLQSLENLHQMANTEGEKDLEYQELILRNMDEHLPDPSFSLGVLAKTVNLSTGYLSSLFKRIFGIPFQDYLLTMRLERSKILLLATSYKVYEVAERVGFDDPNYFSTSFKKKFGISPNRYRDMATGGLS